MPDDESIITTANRGEPASLDEASRAGQAYRNIARRIKGEDIPLMTLEEATGVFSKLKKLFAAG
ncbi:Septum site-determining protein MinD [compost metagenome]